MSFPTAAVSPPAPPPLAHCWVPDASGLGLVTKLAEAEASTGATVGAGGRSGRLAADRARFACCACTRVRRMNGKQKRTATVRYKVSCMLSLREQASNRAGERLY